MSIAWDPATKEGDYTCMVYWRKGKNGKIYIENVKCFKYKKEMKKMSRPYLETKVVKVKKEKKCQHLKYMVGYVPTGSYYECPACGKKVYIKNVKDKKGNWVNGENLDRIKFPFFCRYENNRLGMITSGTPTYGNYEYILHNIDSQSGC